MRWRTGRKNPRTIYVQRGAEPADDDPFIGTLDTPELVARAVAAVNDNANIDERASGRARTNSEDPTSPEQIECEKCAALRHAMQMRLAMGHNETCGRHALTLHAREFCPCGHNQLMQAYRALECTHVPPSAAPSPAAPAE